LGRPGGADETPTLARCAYYAAPQGGLHALGRPGGAHDGGRVMTAQPLLQTKNLCKQFGGLQAIDDVSLDLQAGQITTLVGPNGAGKTTLFNMMTGQFAATSGQVFLRGKSLAGLAAWRIARLGVGRTFQDLRLFNHMTVEENLQTVTEPASWFWQKSRAPDAMAKVLHETGLWDKRRARAIDLAYAERKFLSMARIMVSGANIWLLDEPASGLDPKSFERFVGLVKAYAAQGVTICIIEHNLDLVSQLSDRLAFLDQGRLLACGDPKQILNDPHLAAIYFGER